MSQDIARGEATEMDRGMESDRESGMSVDGGEPEERVSSGGEEERGDERVKEQLRKRRMGEDLRKKKEEEEELVEREKRRLEEEGERRREGMRRERELTMEERVWEVERGLKEIVAAVSREDGKSKLAFGRGKQQIVKNAVFTVQGGPLSVRAAVSRKPLLVETKMAKRKPWK